MYDAHRVHVLHGSMHLQEELFQQRHRQHGRLFLKQLLNTAIRIALHYHGNSGLFFIIMDAVATDNVRMIKALQGIVFLL